MKEGERAGPAFANNDSVATGRHALDPLAAECMYYEKFVCRGVGIRNGRFALTGASETRTRDLLHAMQTRSQLRHGPVGPRIMPEKGSGRNRSVGLAPAQRAVCVGPACEGRTGRARASAAPW